MVDDGTFVKRKIELQGLHTLRGYHDESDGKVR
jgi:hypothetical protein